MIRNIGAIQTAVEAVQFISGALNHKAIKKIVKDMGYKGALSMELITFVLLNYSSMTKSEMYALYPTDKELINYFISRAIECNLLPRIDKEAIEKEQYEYIFSNITMSYRKLGEHLDISKSKAGKIVNKIKNQNNS